MDFFFVCFLFCFLFAILWLNWSDEKDFLLDFYYLSWMELFSHEFVQSPDEQHFYIFNFFFYIDRSTKSIFSLSHFMKRIHHRLPIIEQEKNILNQIITRLIVLFIYSRNLFQILVEVFPVGSNYFNSQDIHSLSKENHDFADINNQFFNNCVSENLDDEEIFHFSFRLFFFLSSTILNIPLELIRKCCRPKKIKCEKSYFIDLHLHLMSK